MDEPLPRRFPLSAPPKKKSRSLLWIQLGIAGGFVIALLGALFVYGGFKLVESITSYPDAAWSTQKFGELSIEAPYPLRVSESHGTPADAEFFEFRNNPAEELRLLINVVRARNAPNIRLDFDTNIRSSLNKVAKAAHDPKPYIELQPLNISGLETLKGTYRAPGYGLGLMADAVSIRDGTDSWHVFVACHHPRMERDFRRVIDSVRIDR